MHQTTQRFWNCYNNLPTTVRERADKCFSLLKENSRHPSLHLKKVNAFWSVRIDLTHRALAVADGDDFIWVWIGVHDEYERLIGR